MEQKAAFLRREAVLGAGPVMVLQEGPFARIPSQWAAARAGDRGGGGHNPRMARLPDFVTFASSALGQYKTEGSHAPSGSL